MTGFRNRHFSINYRPLFTIFRNGKHSKQAGTETETDGNLAAAFSIRDTLTASRTVPNKFRNWAFTFTINSQSRKRTQDNFSFFLFFLNCCKLLVTSKLRKSKKQIEPKTSSQFRGFCGFYDCFPSIGTYL